MKIRRIALPTAIMFAMFLGNNIISAQSSMPANGSVLLNIEAIQPKKNVGLDYQQTMTELNDILKYEVDYGTAARYKGTIEVTVDLNARGEVVEVKFDDNDLPNALENNISTTLKNQVYRPVTINGLAKDQSFKIPLSIK